MVSARSFLVPFVYSDRVSFVVEFSHRKIRLFAKGRPVTIQGVAPSSVLGDITVVEKKEDETAGNILPEAVERIDFDEKIYDINDMTGEGTENETYPPIVIETPYSYDDLWNEEEKCFKLQTIQHSDVLYIFSENYPIRVLKRYSNTDWALEELELEGGPFMSMNSTDISVCSNAQEGRVTLSSSGAMFSKTDVGRLIRLRCYDDSCKVWAADVAVQSGELFISDNKYYSAQNSGTTGTKKPVHGEGIRSDGGVRWKYEHAGMGIVRIGEYVSATEVLGEVISKLPETVKNGTVYWEWGFLHQGAKYPVSGAFFRNRFVFLLNTDEGPYVCFSVSGDYHNFSDLEYGETTAELAIIVPVVNTEFNEGKWLFAGDVLFVGTGAAEFCIDSVSSGAALANDNVKISQISNVGSKAIMPVAVGAHVFFADRYGMSLRDLSYNYYNDGYDQADISILGKHLFASGIVAMSYQETPYKILWCLTNDGTMAALTFSAEQEVAALSRHDFSGKVESLAVTRNPEEYRDDLWIVVKRIINNKTLRTVERMENGMPQALPESVYATESLTERDKLEKEFIRQRAMYLDGAVLFERKSGDNSTVIEGLEHLEGEKVGVFADGAVLPSQIVADGKVNIKATYSRVLVGKEIISQYIPQSIYFDEADGSGIGNPQRINHIVLMLYLSGGGSVGEEQSRLRDILYRSSNGIMNDAQPLFSGNKEILFDGETSKNAAPSVLMIENKTPLPMNILGIVPRVD